MTLDTLRYDVAQMAWRRGLLKTLGPFLGASGWEQRHTPASFTFAAHQAFLAGFLPTPLGPGPHPRLFAADFGGSTSTTDQTFVFEQAYLPQALAARGYQTICIGGTGFFNQQNQLSQVIPGFFQQAFWTPEMGVTCPNSAENQVQQAIDCLTKAGPSKRVFMLHQLLGVAPAQLVLPTPALRRQTRHIGEPFGCSTGGGRCPRTSVSVFSAARNEFSHRLLRPRNGLRRRWLSGSPLRPSCRLECAVHRFCVAQNA